MKKLGKLAGVNFVVSGVFENVTREMLEKFIKQNGGRLVAGVSVKTDYLVTGKILEDSRPVTSGGKYRRAIEMKKKIMTEKEFELFCRERFRDPKFNLEDGVKSELRDIEGSVDEFLKGKDKMVKNGAME